MKNNIKQVRQQKGKSLYWLAKNTGLAYRNLWDVEHGADVKLSTLCRIAEALQCEVIYLIRKEQKHERIKSFQQP